MKVDKSVLSELLKTVLKNVPHEEIESDDFKTRVYYLDDMTVSFNLSDKSFVGLSFEVLSKNFHVLNNLDLLLTDLELNEEDDSEVYLVDNENLAKFVNDFLRVRTTLIETTKV